MQKILNEKGFTLIEILMVVLLVAILAAVSIPQFIDFRVEAKDAATQAAAGTLRTAIANQYANTNLRCNASTFPTTAQLNANDITNGGSPCTTTMISVTSDRAFVAGSVIPDNPWGGSSVAKNLVTTCSGASTGCSKTDTTNCAGNAYAATDGGWCYNPANGQIWPNSSNSTGPAKEYTF